MKRWGFECVRYNLDNQTRGPGARIHDFFLTPTYDHNLDISTLRSYVKYISYIIMLRGCALFRQQAGRRISRAMASALPQTKMSAQNQGAATCLAAAPRICADVIPRSPRNTIAKFVAPQVPADPTVASILPDIDVRIRQPPIIPAPTILSHPSPSVYHSPTHKVDVDVLSSPVFFQGGQRLRARQQMKIRNSLDDSVTPRYRQFLDVNEFVSNEAQHAHEGGGKNQPLRILVSISCPFPAHRPRQQNTGLALST